jgi:hypothetical protein
MALLLAVPAIPSNRRRDLPQLHLGNRSGCSGHLAGYLFGDYIFRISWRAAEGGAQVCIPIPENHNMAL